MQNRRSPVTNERPTTRGLLARGAWCAAACMLLSGQALAQAEAKPAPAPKPAAAPASEPAPGLTDEIELQQMIRVMGEPTNVDELLDALEVADRGLTTLQAQIRYDRRFVLQGDRHVRMGDLAFSGKAAGANEAPLRTFAINFKTLQIDDELRDDPNSWVFDGEWLVEIRPAERRFTKRRMALPGTRVDPLGLGESPIPFPIGQRKAKIMARYDAVMLKAFDGLDEPAPAPAPGTDAEAPSEEARRDIASWRATAKDTYQLKLTPRAEFKDQDNFREIRLWYTKEEFLPRMARAVNRQGDESVVQLINLKVNEKLPAHAIRIEEPTDPGWDVQVDEGRFAPQSADDGPVRPGGDAFKSPASQSKGTSGGAAPKGDR